MHPIIETRHLMKRYGDAYALNDVSLAIPKGSIFGLLGPNGAGKTTLIRMITQITAPDEGQILFHGHALHAEHNKKIGYLPEERGLYKKAKIGEQLLYLAQLKGMDKHKALEKAKEWFIRLDIKEWWNKNLEELSKGMAQKVQFISTVIHEPEFIILDEPFSGFDPVNSDVIRDEILRLHAEGATILFSTHRMDTVEELCSHVVLIDRSRKILDGSTIEIRNRFKTNRFLIETLSPLDFEKLPWEAEIQNQTSGDRFLSAFRLVDGQSSNELLTDVMYQSVIGSFREEIPHFHEIFIQAVTQNQEKS